MGKIKQKLQNQLLELKNLDKQTPDFVEKVMNKLPQKLLVKFYVEHASKEDLQKLVQQSSMLTMSSKELLIKKFYKKKRVQLFTTQEFETLVKNSIINKY